MAPLHRSTAAPQPGQLQIQHFTHQHLLQKLFMGSEFKCDGCKTSGYGLRYRCSACDFDLHEECATSPHRISSHLHPHQLLLVNRPGNSHFCDVCKGFTDGLSYTCHSQMCEFDVHPLCTHITVATGVPSPSVTLNPCQQHPPTIHKHQQQQGIPTTAYGGYNNQPVMINHQHKQQQGMPTAGFGGYNNQQPISMMMNHQYQQQQQQGMATAAFGGYNNHPVMMNQQQGMATTAFGGYNNNNNNNQAMMMNQQQQGRSNNYSKVGKLAANILMTSLIGVPINFNSKN